MKWCDKNYLSSVLQLRLKYEGEKKQKKKENETKNFQYQLSIVLTINPNGRNYFLNRLGSNNSNGRVGQVLDYRFAYRPHRVP